MTGPEDCLFLHDQAASAEVRRFGCHRAIGATPHRPKWLQFKPPLTQSLKVERG
jgi:hypothetical protein